MKRITVAALCIGLLLPLSAGAQAQGQPASPADVSYSIGMIIGANLRGSGIDIDPQEFLAGFAAMLDRKATRLSLDQAQSSVRAALQEAAKKKADENLAAGKAFLAGNAKKDGVKTTASGLQYEVLVPGSGQPPKASDTVTVNYEGKLLDGTVFDSSIQRNQPATFALSGVIPGWTEGLQLMPAGSKYRFYIPSELGYGEQGAGDSIGPNEVLVFEVELISIKAAK